MKKILLVGMNFYDYESEIRKALEKKGYCVDVVSDEPACFKTNQKLIPSFLLKYGIRAHLRNILKFVNKRKYSHIIFLVGRSLTDDFMRSLRKLQPEAKFILYLWDNIGRINNYDITSKYADKILTFDSQDANEYGISFLPLFYGDEYKSIKKGTYESDVYSVLTNHSDRMLICQKLCEKYDNYSFNVDLMVGKITFLKNKLLKNLPNYKGQIHYLGSPISTSKIIIGIEKCKAVLDIQHPTQRGLTMRTIETLAAKRKLLTTNSDIKYYDFYDENYVLIIDRNNPEIKEGFLTEINDYEIDMKKYSIDFWIEVLLGNSTTNYLNDIGNLKYTNVNNKGE